MDQFLFYLKLGFNHVMDIKAYDHVLFFLVLVVPYAFNSWKRVLWLVTIFTIGHTLSLMLSVYGVIRVKASLVEFLIPITILVTALFNIFTASKSPKNERFGLLLIISLFFGLIHGLGFSNYFKQIVASEESKLLPMLEFAIGIEVAQILVVLIVLILAFVGQTIFRFSRRDWVMVMSAIVVGVVLPMVMENGLF